MNNQYPKAMKKILLILAILVPSFCLGQVSSLDVKAIKVDSVNQAIYAMLTKPPEFRFLPNFLPNNYNSLNNRQYEATVLDGGFDSFLATQKSKDFYSINMLKARNTYLVSEWNYRCGQPTLYDPKVYEQKIDYEAHIDYGLDVEYTLYMFFKFMAEKEGVVIGNLAVN